MSATGFYFLGLHPLSFNLSFVAYLSHPLSVSLCGCLPLLLLPRLLRSLQLHQEMGNLLKGGSRSKSCSIRQPARKRGVLTIGRVHGWHVGGRKKNGRTVGVRWQSLTGKRDSGKGVDGWIVTWHISHPNAPCQQSFSLTTLLKVKTEWPFCFFSIIQSGIDFWLVIFYLSFLGLDKSLHEQLPAIIFSLHRSCACKHTCRCLLAYWSFSLALRPKCIFQT